MKRRMKITLEVDVPWEVADHLRDKPVTFSQYVELSKKYDGNYSYRLETKPAQWKLS